MPIEEKILSCSLILEAFGNAKTIRNHNSSRFGKYVRIWMSPGSRKIKEADIINYLLEKSRVSVQGIGERNYHIFYHFLRGASKDLLQSLGLSSNLKDYEYLNKSNCYDAENINDSSLFKGVCECLDLMRFSKDEINAIWHVLAAILKLGNLGFDDAKKTDTHPCTIPNEALFEQISSLLSIDKEILRSALVIKTRITDKEKFLCPLDKHECVSVRDSLSKCLYDKVFNWMIKRLNLAIRNDTEEMSPVNCLSIGLLDIFGFEDFKINSLEQFCINFTNEKLQQLYISFIFKSERREFINEGLEQFLGQISYQDNQPIIDLFDKPPFGIFLLLDESTTLKSSDDKRLLETLVKSHKDNPNFKAPKSIIETFTVVHSMKSVEYNITGFRMKNKDEINSEIKEALTNSRNLEIYNIYMCECSSGDSPTLMNKSIEESKELNPLPLRRMGKSTGGQDKFLGTKFRNQMKSLMEELMSCDAHFVRCIKPNEEKKSDFFVPITVLSQIRYLGLLDSIKIRKNTFPARREFKDFYRKYEMLLRLKGAKDYEKEVKAENYRFLAEEIVKIALGPEFVQSEVLLGKSKIYLKGEIEDKLDKVFLKIWKEKREKAEKILRQYKTFKYRVKVLERLQVTYRRIKRFERIQAIWKGKTQRKRYLRKKEATLRVAGFIGKQILKVLRSKLAAMKEKILQKVRMDRKKRAAKQILTLSSKVSKSLLSYFVKKFQGKCKQKTLTLNNKKRERIEKLKVLLENTSQIVSKLLIRKTKQNLAFFHQQCTLKRQFMLDRRLKEVERAQEVKNPQLSLREELERAFKKKQNLADKQKPSLEPNMNQDVRKKSSEDIRQRGKSTNLMDRKPKPSEESEFGKIEFVAVKRMELREEKNKVEIRRADLHKMSDTEFSKLNMSPIKGRKISIEEGLNRGPPKFQSQLGPADRKSKVLGQAQTFERKSLMKQGKSQEEIPLKKELLIKVSPPEVKRTEQKEPPQKEQTSNVKSISQAFEKPLPKPGLEAKSEKPPSMFFTPSGSQGHPLPKKEPEKSPAIAPPKTPIDEEKKTLKISVKDMAKNLGSANLQFRPFPGGGIPRQAQAQNPSQRQEIPSVNNDLNDMLMDRAASKPGRKKPAKKVFDFEEKPAGNDLFKISEEPKANDNPNTPIFKTITSEVLSPGKNEENELMLEEEPKAMETNKSETHGSAAVKTSIFAKEEAKIGKNPNFKSEIITKNVKTSKVSEFAANFQKNINASAKVQAENSTTTLKPPEEPSKVSVKEMAKNMSMASLPLNKSPVKSPSLPKNPALGPSPNRSTLEEEKGESSSSKDNNEKKVSSNISDSIEKTIESKTISAKLPSFEKQVRFEPSKDLQGSKPQTSKNQDLIKSETCKEKAVPEDDLRPPIVTKVSVKELSKNLNNMNLPFRSMMERSKPPERKSEAEEEKKEQTAVIQDSFNEIMMDRGANQAGAKKKRKAKKAEDFDF